MSEELAKDTILGGFQIVRKIGEGGMGNVYLAKQLTIERYVALKVLSKALVDQEDIVLQFRKEVQLSGRIHHPNIVRAIDAGEQGDYCYMAITYVEGEDFEKILDREKIMPEKEGLAVAARIAEVLEYAWDKHSLIHRDIKPGNIMRNSKGEVFLMDLGIAQNFDIRKKQGSEEVLGSPFYMSPEQGQGLPLDWRTDLYSLGATLYHMVVGVPPYDSQDITTIVEMHIGTPFPEPSTRNPQAVLNPATVKLLRKMLAKKPEDRQGNWKEAIDEIRSAMKPPAAGKAPASRRRMSVGTGPAAMRKKSGIGATFAILNALVIVAVAVFVAYRLYMGNLDRNADGALKSAESYLKKFPGDYEGALLEFAQAEQYAKGTSYEEKARKRHLEVREQAEAQREKIKYFDGKVAEARALMAKKSYSAALDMLEKIRDIEDEGRRRMVASMIENLREITQKQD